MFLYGTLVLLVGQNLLIAMMTSTYEEKKRVAKLEFKVTRVNRIVYYTCSPRLTPECELLEYFAILFGNALCALKLIDFKPGGGWQHRAAFPWEHFHF